MAPIKNRQRQAELAQERLDELVANAPLPTPEAAARLLVLLTRAQQPSRKATR